MTAVIAWGATTLAASTALMLLVLAVRAPYRGWAGPRLGYALWALPAVRMILPPVPAGVLGELPVAGPAATRMSVLFAGPHGVVGRWDTPHSSLGITLAMIWLAGAVGLFTLTALRHLVFCRRLRASATPWGGVGGIRIITADVAGPLAFGVLRRFIAVPLTFDRDYRADERDFALAHERAHHLRGDLIANWISLAVLAAHWWNPVAWVAVRAFRDDQEFAVDARLLTGKPPGACAIYAGVLAKAAGIGALPASNLDARTNLKGRLIMLTRQPHSSRRRALAATALTLFGGSALATTAIATTGAPVAASGGQAVTIGVKPDGSGGFGLVLGNELVAPGAPLPRGMRLPADFTGPGGCDLKSSAKPVAMVIKGFGATRTYTVMCASAAPAPLRATLAEGLASLNTMRTSVAAQRTPSFPEAERLHALGAIDRSIGEVEAALASPG